MSRVIQFHELGGPEVLKVEERADVAPKAGEVAFRVKAIGLNWSEALIRQGRYVQEWKSFPASLGNEASGIVEAVGEGVTQFAVGDRVSIIVGASQTENPTYAERIVIGAAHVARVPDNIDLEEAAGMWATFLTGYCALFEIAKIQRGQSVLITAASSGTGQAAIQMAKAHGVRVIATTRGQEKKSAILEAGADEVIVTTTENLVDRVSALTHGEGVDLVYDCVGGHQLEQLGDVVKAHGWLISYGFSGGFDIRYPLIAQTKKFFRFQVYQVLEFTGSKYFGLPRNDDVMKRAIKYIGEGFESGKFSVRIDKRFAFDDIVNAHRALEAGTHVGKLIVTVN